MAILKRIYNKCISLTYGFVNSTFEKSLRKRLKNKDFSIICSNCIGGTIYHRLGQQFLSPTINLFLFQDDFIKMIKNLKWYMSQDLVFFKSEKFNFPTAKLGDVTIHFNHAKTEDEAMHDWNRRKVRINYDNLYIILYEKDGLTRDQLLDLKNVSCKKLIVLSKSKENTDIPYVYYIKASKPAPNNLHLYFLDRDVFEIRKFEKKWDFVSWLND